tara:strand:+ start:290 stop:760 length:471 start_codon:yes stop_codon:yes gene_type:complete
MAPKEIKKIMFETFLIIQGLNNVPYRVKNKMLGALFDMNPNPWRVIGITEKAIIRFKEHDFKYKARMGINRSHIFPRYKRNKVLLHNDNWTLDKWWDYFYQNDKCILATSTENLNKEKIVSVKDVPKGLFRSSGYSFTVKEKEQLFLKECFKNLRK